MCTPVYSKCTVSVHAVFSQNHLQLLFSTNRVKNSCVRKKLEKFRITEHIDNQQVFLVAGGWDGSNYLSSTETLVEGGQAWNLQQGLPSGRYALRGISLPNTVIMIGKKSPHFYF